MPRIKKYKKKEVGIKTQLSRQKAKSSIFIYWMNPVPLTFPLFLLLFTQLIPRSLTWHFF